jgi:hypothetical protein
VSALFEPALSTFYNVVALKNCTEFTESWLDATIELLWEVNYLQSTICQKVLAANALRYDEIVSPSFSYERLLFKHRSSTNQWPQS